jgi:hypothetical protein
MSDLASTRVRLVCAVPPQRVSHSFVRLAMILGDLAHGIFLAGTGRD